jgi:2-hydroxychromene-2-carboxylate isomerase
MSLDAAYQAAYKAMFYDGSEVYEEEVRVGIAAFLSRFGIDPADLINAEVRNHAKTCEHGWFIEHDSIETGFCHGGAPLAPVGEGNEQ